jgi:hypothetical protein
MLKVEFGYFGEVILSHKTSNKSVGDRVQW